MQKDTVVEHAIDFIKSFFAEEYSGHDCWHSLRVYATATALAQEEDADVQLVQLAALLHDVDDRKLSPGTCAGKDNAVSFLTREGVDKDTIHCIVQIIEDISFSGGARVPASLEGKCVQDADRLDALGAIGIARTFAYGGSHARPMYDPTVMPQLNMTPEQYRSAKSTSVNHFYEKLFQLKALMNTDAAKKAAEHREATMKAFLDEFLLEWNGADWQSK